MNPALRAAPALAFALLACDPEIPAETHPERAVAEFDPSAAEPVIPRPNDLAIDPVTGLVTFTDPQGTNAAQAAYNRYLRTLDGFPVEADASITFTEPLDPASVRAEAVRVLDVTNPLDVRAVEGTEVRWNEPLRRIEISPPGGAAGRWTKSRQYAIAVLGGPSGVAAASGREVVGSSAFYLLRSRKPLVSGCADLSSATCESTTPLISGDNAGLRAARLERARRYLAPALERLEDMGVPREQLVAGWTFSTVKQPLVTFDPASGAIPFPNALLMKDGRVNLPILPADDPTTQAMKRGLNQLDGFSTTAHLITELSDTSGAADERLDGSTLSAAAFVLANAADPAEQVPVEAVCRSCAGAGSAPGAEPDQVAFRPWLPLRSSAQHAALWRRGVRAFGSDRVANAGSAFALARIEVPLVDGEGHSLIDGLDDATANAVEPLRASMQPLMQLAEGLGVQREDLLLAWTFPTLTTAAALPALAALPGQWQLTTAVVGSPRNVVPVDTAQLQALATALGQSFEIRAALEGAITVGNALEALSATEGAFSPVLLSNPREEQVPFLLTLPRTAAGPQGAIPIAIFQHGLGGSRRHGALIANTLAQRGLATLAIDAPLHGMRSFCTSDAECLSGGQCVQHRCPGGYAFAPGDPTETPTVSGRGFVSTADPFATRDHFRQATIDLNQLIRSARDATAGIGAIEVDDPATPEAVERLDATTVRYVGQSLGGIIGTLATAAIPDIRASTLNVPGAGLADVILLAPRFAAEKQAFDQMLAARGILTGSQRYEYFIDLVRWILDPSDPQNFGRHLIAEPLTDPSSGAPMASKKVFVSWIAGDAVIPNVTTERLIRSVVVPAPKAGLFQDTRYSGGGHGFLLDYAAPALTLSAQAHAADWIEAPP